MHNRMSASARLLTMLLSMVLFFSVTVVSAASVSISANPANVTSGVSTTLTWSSTGATSCAATGDWSGRKAVSGSQSVFPLNATNAYSLNCSGPLGSASSAAAVTVGAPPNTPPTVALTSPAFGATFTAPASIAISATAAATVTNATISKVDFYNGASLLGTALTTPYTFTWTAVPTGSYSLTARATDSLGSVATSAAVSVTVSAPGVLTVSLSTPLSGASYMAPADVAVTASAAAVSGATITNIELYAGTTLIGSGATSPLSDIWSAVIPGTYTLTAKAYDSQGATATSAPVTVTITAAPGETITFLHNDLAGNPIAATDVNGAIVWRESYSPYGDRQKIQAASSANRQWFGGKPLDSETGLSNFGARPYDSFVGRFYGIDAVGFSEKNIHSFNRYAYGNNNPFRFIDLDGNSASDIFEGTDYGSGPVDVPNFLTPAGEVAIGAAASLIPAVRLVQMVGKFFGAGKAEKDPGKDSGTMGLPDSAQVCRGGTCTAERFAAGTDNGTVSVNSGAGKTVSELTATIPNKQVGVTTVGQIRNAGGDVKPSGNGKNPNHCDMCGITPQQAEKLFTPTIKNPNIN